MKHRSTCAILAALLGLAAPTFAADGPGSGTLLLRQPNLSQERLAFVYAGDIWIADRSGQQPVRLTSHGSASQPFFSPDGKMIAYSAAYDGNTDVYVIPVSGGEPRRLTFHSGVDAVCGWSADGKRVLFASQRAVANNRSRQFYEVPLSGGFERKLMEAVAFEGTWSPDNTRLAYRPYNTAYAGASGWRLYRGGATTPIWIIDPASGALEKIPHQNATDLSPLWLGEEVVFISDRDGQAANVFAYHTKTKALRQLTKETVWDVRSLGGQGSTVVFEAGGALKELDLASGTIKPLVVDVSTETAQSRPQWKDASKTITSVVLSPTGKRALISARGDIFTVPVKDGSVRNLTRTAGVREKDGLWSADGKQIAYLTESKFQHFIVLRDQAGLEAPRLLPLPKPFYYTLLAFSPDGKRLALQDNHLTLYSLSVEKGELTKVEASPRGLRGNAFGVSFSPDGRFLAYSITGENHFSRIRVFDLNEGKAHDVTDGLSDATGPTFAASDYLYFTASINSGPVQVGLDMSSQERAVRRGIYAVVLAADGKPPLLPKSGDEDGKKDEKDEKDENKPANKDAKDADKPAKSDKSDKSDKEKPDKEKAEKDKADKDKPDKAEKPPKPTRIDFDGLAQRIVALPLAERNYDELAVGSDGALFYLEVRQPGVSREPPEAEAGDNADLYRYDLSERKTKLLKAGIASFTLSADRKKLLVRSAKGKLETGDASEKFEAKAIDLAQLGMRINPPEEWRQIFDEAWWMEKEFFYDPKLHGLDWDAVYARYSPFVQHVKRREDLSELLVELIAELQVGHNRTGGGDTLKENKVTVGLLGADYAVENNRYRVKTVYPGDRWNPFLKAPLMVPGSTVKEGEYLLAVNGANLTPAQNIYELFENTVGKQTTLTVGSDPAGTGSRSVVVEPIADEAGLRQWAWIERNRLYVEKKTGGKVAYVYLPNTAGDGFQYFNRMYFAQAEKPALIVDERRNGGGQAANYITEILGRPYLAGWRSREALVFGTPGAGIYGPKVMLIDQDAGSGGDFLPWSFKRLRLGTVIGTRTWGGLIGISANPPLIDGGFLTVPFFRFFTPDGEWRVENEGVAPDVEVELDPAEVNRGNDPQLDAAIATVLKNLSTDKPVDRRESPPVPTTLGK